MAGDFTKESSDSVGDVLNVTSLGVGVKLVSNEKVEATHAFCIQHLELPAFAGERSVDQEHVKFLIRHARRGTFHPEWVTWITARCDEPCHDLKGVEQPAKTLWRMNGQHTAWMRLEMPEKGFRCPINLMRYTCRTAYDMRQLYSTIDRLKGRSYGHVIKSYLEGTEEFRGFSAAARKYAHQGLSLWLFEHGAKKAGRDADDIAYLMQTDYFDATQKVMAFLSTLPYYENRFLFRSGTIASMYAMFSKAPEIAVAFWSAVATGLGFESQQDPRLKLRNELMTAVVNQGPGVTSANTKKVSSEEMYRWCIAAWNAYREGRSLKLIKAARGERPSVK